MAEPAKNLQFSKEKVKTINHALRVLNEAAEYSTDEIRDMVGKDYRKLRRLLNEVQPSVKDAIEEMKVATTSTVGEISHTVDEAVHKRPWPFFGAAAFFGAIAGFYFGRKSKP